MTRSESARDRDLRRRRGFALVELSTAIFVLTVALGAAASLHVRAILVRRAAQERAVAVDLAREGLEAARAGVEAAPDPECIAFLREPEIRVERSASAFDGLDAVRAVVRWGPDPERRREVRLETLVERREP